MKQREGFTSCSGRQMSVCRTVCLLSDCDTAVGCNILSFGEHLNQDATASRRLGKQQTGAFTA